MGTSFLLGLSSLTWQGRAIAIWIGWFYDWAKSIVGGLLAVAALLCFTSRGRLFLERFEKRKESFYFRLILLMSGIWMLTLAPLKMAQYLSLQGTGDAAMYLSVIWNAGLRGMPDIVQGVASHLQDHFEPILLGYSPLAWILRSPFAIMMTHALITSSSVFVLWFLGKRCKLPPFYGSQEPTITTWFGPRIHPTTGLFQFHNGIDYSRPYGDPILAVEDGTVNSITDQGSSGYVLRFTGTTGAWSHLHIFKSGALPVTLTNGWQLYQSGGQLKIYRPAITLAYGVSFSSRVISATAGENSIAAREPIAPVGVSGIGTGAHLHFNFDSGNSSALQYIRHTKGNPTITFITSPSGNIYGGTLSTATLATTTVTVRIDASAYGKDLDKVEFLVDGTVQSFPGSSTDTFRFGGVAPQTQIGMTQASPGGDGVQPVQNDVFRPYFNRLLDLTALGDGYHNICIQTKNVNGDYISPQACISFNIA